jgi:hypothetical protein
LVHHHILVLDRATQAFSLQGTFSTHGHAAILRPSLRACALILSPCASSSLNTPILNTHISFLQTRLKH